MSETEHLDVLVIGAGLSGICAGHHLQESAPWASYAILEARAAMGGTWDLFRYPGVRSDSDMYTLGFPFRPWNGDDMIVDGDEIRAYIEDTVRGEGIDARIRFHHRVVHMEWDTASAHWLVTAERSDTDETVQFTCDFVPPAPATTATTTATSPSSKAARRSRVTSCIRSTGPTI